MCGESGIAENKTHNQVKTGHFALLVDVQRHLPGSHDIDIIKSRIENAVRWLQVRLEQR